MTVPANSFFAQHQRLRVLLVDDDADQEVLMRDLLEEAYGAHVDLTCAPGFDQALAAVAAAEYDVCFVDHHLGGRTGLELIDELRDRRVAVPCVMLTGSRDPAVDAAAAGVGASDYLEKDGLTSRLLRRSIHYALERRRAADALRTSEERYRALVENAAEAVIVLDERGKAVYASCAVERILGYTADELLAMNGRTLLHPDDRDRCLEAFSRCLRQPGSCESFETRHRHRDGSWRWMHCALANRLQERAVQGVVVNVRDVTDTVLMLQALRLQADVGRTFADASDVDQIRPAILRTIGEVLDASVAIKWRFDADTGGLTMVESWTKSAHPAFSHFVEVSGRSLRADGAGLIAHALGLAQPLCIRALDEVGPDDRRKAATEAGLRTTIMVPIEGKPNQPRGVLEIIWNHAYTGNQRLLDMVGAIGRQLGQCLERIETRSALVERDHQLRALFDRSSDAIVIITEEGVFVDANPAAVELFGVPRERLIGSRIDQYVAAESGGASLEAWHALGRVPEATGELVFIRDGGERRFVDFRATANVLPHRHMAVLRDVTEQRALEQQFLHSQKMETVGRLAGGIAHDFNNLLTAIIGNAELLRDHAAGGGDWRECADEILKACRSAAELTRQLLAFSRKQVMKTVPFDLNEAVVGMNRMLRRLIGENIELSSRLAEGLAPVLADPTQIEQVLVNLAVNARDAMPSGGKLTIETRLVDVDARNAATHPGMPHGRFVALTVSDTGVGMDAETLSRIFEPFFSTKAQGHGTGLGLATAYGTVRQTGGDIRVSSEPSVGTTFTVYLPAAPNARVVAQPQTPDRVEGGSETILVVEDADQVRQLAAAILRRAGYRVLEAADGQDACDLLARYPDRVDLLLTDVVMPGMNGRQAFEHLSAQRPSMRVIYCSGYAPETVVHHGVLSRGRAFLQKPYTTTGLLQTVRQVLNTGVQA